MFLGANTNRLCFVLKDLISTCFFKQILISILISNLKAIINMSLQSGEGQEGRHEEKGRLKIFVEGHPIFIFKTLRTRGETILVSP